MLITVKKMQNKKKNLLFTYDHLVQPNMLRNTMERL